MSRDTNTSCTDCQGRVEASFVPSASLFPVHTKPDESNESNDWQKLPIRPVTSSVAITYTSDTDGWFGKDIIILKLLAFGFMRITHALMSIKIQCNNRFSAPFLVFQKVNFKEN